ncbi:MAG: aminotransferase [Pseudomonadota bacterium]
MYALNSAIQDVAAPPIAAVHEWVAGRTYPADRPLLDVAQAVPVEPPPAALRESVAAALVAHGAHRYTPIAGLPELREALAAHMSAQYDGNIRADDTVITAGCNQAFCLTVKALAAPGEAIVLPEPYYFNHQMWLEMCGIEVQRVPFAPERRGVPDVDSFAAAMTPATRAIAVVSPNNPTGAVYDAEHLEALFELAQRHRVALILDETYKDFHPASPAAPHKLFRRADWRGTLVQLFSFSKSYALTGYRVGSVIAGPELVRETTKIQDCVNICAPRLSQLMALEAIRTLAPYVRHESALMRVRVEALKAAFAGIGNGRPGGFELVASGAWFAYVRHPFRDRDSTEVARYLAEEHGVLCVPGEVFGEAQRDYVRFAFANLAADEMPALIARLATAGAGH